MPAHDITMNAQTRIIRGKDVEFEIKSGRRKLGSLLISQGNVEWVPTGHSANRYRISWEKFSELMVDKGRKVKV